MLNRYPKHVPTFIELLQDPLMKRLTNQAIGRAFGVSERTVRRWKATEAPVSVRVALWVFSCEGLEIRYCERARLSQLIGPPGAAHLVGGWVPAANDAPGEKQPALRARGILEAV